MSDKMNDTQWYGSRSKQFVTSYDVDGDDRWMDGDERIDVSNDKIP